MTRFDARKKYPWSEWQDGKTHTLKESEFDVPIERIKWSIRKRANVTETYVNLETTFTNETVLTFTFFESHDAYEASKKARKRDRKGHFDADQPSQFPCTICGAETRPEWGNKCYVRTNEPGPDTIKSASGANLAPKHESETE